jgi:Icc-related predicted phosphoesterase
MVYVISRAGTGGAPDVVHEQVWLDLGCLDDRMSYMMAPSSTIPGTTTRTVRLLTVSDLHQRSELYTGLHKAVRTHRPDAVILCGDFLHAMEPEHGMLSVAECAQAVACLEVARVLAVRGNHEHVQFADFADAMATATASFTTLHGEAAQVGDMTLLGFECLLGNDVAFTLLKQLLPPEPGAWVPKLMGKLGPAGRCLWIAHEPPSGTPLSASSGPLSGNPEWTALVERFNPRLMVCGHDHTTPTKCKRWHHRIGETVVVNVGQSDGTELHYSVIEALFDANQPSLPRRMTVSGFPWGQSIELPAR